MGTDKKTVIACCLIVLIFIFILGTGWVKNIIKLSECDFEKPYKAEVIHSIGVIPLVGMITGWMDIDDGNEQKNND